MALEELHESFIQDMLSDEVFTKAAVLSSSIRAGKHAETVSYGLSVNHFSVTIAWKN